MILLRTILLLCTCLSCAAYGQEKTPIRYEVKDNNRIFAPGEHGRYVSDLNKYIRCAAFNLRKAPVDRTASCESYRSEGTVAGKLVPNLRGGDLNREYATRYDKINGEYAHSYAVDKKRTISMFLDPAWISSHFTQPVTCRWIITSPYEKKILLSEGCRPVDHDVHLTLTNSGEVLEWAATANVNIESSKELSQNFETSVLVRDFLIVAMGDSLTSGEGNPERNWTEATPAQWTDYRCHRSLFSYPVMMAATLALADPRHSITLIHVACSGAQINEGMLGEYTGAISRDQAIAIWRRGWFGRKRMQVPEHWERYGTGLERLPPQIDQVRDLLLEGASGRSPNLLIFSIGVNDVGFVPLLEKLAKKDCQEECLAALKKSRSEQLTECSYIEDRLTRSFNCLEQLLRKLKTEIELKIHPKQTYLIEYPNPLRDENNNLCMSQPHHAELLKGFLGTFGNILSFIWSPKLSLKEIEFAESEFLNRLKRAHLDVSSIPSWRTIEHQGPEDMRGFCASPKWYHSYQESQLRQYLNPNSRTDSVGTLHPNAIGHEHLMVRILSRLRKDGTLAGHNFSLLSDTDFHNDNPADGLGGIAWIIGNTHKEDVTRYYKF